MPVFLAPFVYDLNMNTNCILLQAQTYQYLPTMLPKLLYSRQTTAAVISIAMADVLNAVSCYLMLSSMLHDNVED